MHPTTTRPNTTFLFRQALAIGVLLLMGADVEAAKPPCESHYVQTGAFITGRQFTTWDVVEDVPVAAALKRITLEGVKSGLTVAHSDIDLGILAFSQANAGVTNTGQQVDLPWNVTIESEGSGSKITVSKTTPGGYATSQDFQIASMCAVIDAARSR
ncbi:MAG: hypothetical protein ABI650_09725 [Dokdonella sp.]